MRNSKILIVAVFICLCFYECRKPEKPCERRQGWHDSVSLHNMWLLSYKVGDTVKLNMYKISRDSLRTYSFIKEVQCVAKDSNWVMLEHTPADECYEGNYLHSIQMNFEGEYNLSCLLIPLGSEDILRIHFYNRFFDIPTWKYNYRGSRWFPILDVGGKRYYSVNAFEGFKTDFAGRIQPYVDSTYAFYNEDHGIIKFIIDDSIAFIRKP